MKSIAIDGPAGAGKSTVAKALSDRLKYKYLDTGAMYRACAYFMFANGVDLNDFELVNSMLPNMLMNVYYNNSDQYIEVNGTDVTKFLRTSQMAIGASNVGKNPAVREKLVDIQRKLSKKYNIIMDGRDIGTYVIPDADYKFYITADVEERAKRRLLEDNVNITPELLKKMINEINFRDKNDSERLFAPLKQAEDAILIDSTNLSLKKVVELISSFIKE